MTATTLPRLDPSSVRATVPPSPSQPAGWRRVVFGSGASPAWVRPAVGLLLLVTGVLYLWGLGVSGWANSFYSAAVQAGSTSWKAFFFGSSDAANFITVDKPPAALWVMDLSARLFGVNAWAILVPQALEGVAAVGILYAAVRRWFGPVAGLIAGAVLATTPVAALMFRFNNPDSLLVLLLTIAAYATVRAIEKAQTGWLVTAGALVGLAFLTKMLQAFLVVPAFAVAYLLFAPTTGRRRVLQLLGAGAAMAVSSFWWVVAVQLVPAADRPYIGGSQDNSLWNLIFGYNGFGRITGNESGSVGGGGQAGSRWGVTGLVRLFNTDFGSQISWLLPAALILLVGAAVLTWRTRRTDANPWGAAALVIWGGWLLVTAIVFSLGEGIIHPYYTVALAPAIGALIGVGATMLWSRRSSWVARGFVAAAVVATVVWSWELLRRTPTWLPWLAPTVLILGLVAAALLFWGRARGRFCTALVAGTLLVCAAGPAAYTLSTVRTPHSGAIPSAGPAAAAGSGGGPGGARRFGGAPRPTAQPASSFGFPGGGPGGFVPGGGFSGGGVSPGGGFGGGGVSRGGFGGVTSAGGAGGLLNGSTPSAALTTVLEQSSNSFTWVAAAIGSNDASGYQLATDDPVMAIGGFNGTDPAPTLAQFEALVAKGRIHYFIAGGAGGGGGFGPGGGTGTTTPATQISQWVENNFSSTSVGGITLYDLTSPLATSGT